VTVYCKASRESSCLHGCILVSRHQPVHCNKQDALIWLLLLPTKEQLTRLGQPPRALRAWLFLPATVTLISEIIGNHFTQVRGGFMPSVEGQIYDGSRLLDLDKSIRAIRLLHPVDS
jgi:hypothetical protein